jgi:protein-disulfide isomerase
MPSALLRFLAASTLGIACARSDAASRDTTKPATAPAATTTAAAAAAPAATAPDTISARADSGRVLGNPSAQLWVIEASDFQCPYCKQWHDADFQKLVDKYVKTGKIRLAFLNMPLGMHQHALAAAEAAMCASVQGKFWQMHDALFASQQTWEALQDPSGTFASLAGKSGVNMGAWNKCVKDHLTLPMIQADRERVVAAHVNSTPTFFVGNQILEGADVPLAAAIDSALAKQGAQKPGN